MKCPSCNLPFGNCLHEPGLCRYINPTGVVSVRGWRPWFAWYPTSAGWMRWVERREKLDKHGKFWGWEHRPMNLDDYP